VYGPDSRPIWYVASDVRQRNGDHLDPTGTPVLSGDLYAMTGTAPPQATQVGSIRLAQIFPNDLGITYVIDGRQTQKALKRLTWSDASESLVGDWVGGFAADATSSCEARPGAVQAMRVRQVGGGRMSLTFTGPAQAPACEANVAYSQAGSLANLAGAYECRAAPAGAVVATGTFEMSEIIVNDRSGLAGRLRFDSAGCSAVRGGVGLARLPTP
jgi:hypothetical protein